MTATENTAEPASGSRVNDSVAGKVDFPALAHVDRDELFKGFNQAANAFGRDNGTNSFEGRFKGKTAFAAGDATKLDFSDQIYPSSIGDVQFAAQKWKTQGPQTRGDSQSLGQPMGTTTDSQIRNPGNTGSSDSFAPPETRTKNLDGSTTVTRPDQSGYTRTDNEDGSFSEKHFGNRPGSSFTRTGDGKGNTVERTETEKGYSEIHRSKDAEKTFTRDVTRDGDKTTERNQYLNDEKKNYTRTTTDLGNGARSENVKYDQDPKKNYTLDHQPDGKGGFTENRTYANAPENNHTTTFTPDGKGGGVTQEKYADSSRDHKTTTAITDGGKNEKHEFGDQTKNYTREVRKDGTTITDAEGLKIQFKGGSPEFQEELRQAVADIPARDRRAMATSGMDVVGAERVTDAVPRLEKEDVRGWEKGSTWRDPTGGFVDGKHVVVAERGLHGLNKSVKGVLNHEVGHAIDRVTGDESHSQEFGGAYEADKKNLSPDEKHGLKYLMQDGNAGKEELFADLYASLRGSSSIPEQTKQMLEKFPNVREHLKKKWGIE